MLELREMNIIMLAFLSVQRRTNNEYHDRISGLF